jgi:predicted ATPase/class 3 adenylate cyclase
LDFATRATYTVLFTDLVDSTAQRARLGDDAADRLTREHDALLRAAVERNSGSVVKSTGDGVMAAFLGAADGLAAAVEIQQDLHDFNRTAPEPLNVRSGLSLGDAGSEDGDLHGTPVVEAARLCAAATGGEILCAEIVRLVAGSRAVQVFTPVGALDLKGLPEPIETFRVEWEPRAATDRHPGTVDFPRSLEPGTRFPFVGRRDEMQRLLDGWRRADGGERGLVLVGGEPGIGKTRLAGEVARRAQREGGVVLHGRCDDEMGVPYQPFVEALTYFVDHADPEALEAALGRHAGELARLVPHLSDLFPHLAAPLSSDPETEQYRLFEAVGAWLAAASGPRPLLVVLDDLQWAAKPTLLMLRHVVGATEPARLLVVATYRDTEVSRSHPLGEVLADLRRLPGVSRVSLGGLVDDEVVDMLASAAGHELDAPGLALAHVIYTETDGNPLFAGEVLRHLAETGAIVERDGRWSTAGDVNSLGIPEGVREVIGRRLNRLSDRANQILELASVIGRGFELPVLAELVEVDDDDLVQALDEAVDARLVREIGVGQYMFMHALIRSALYDEVRPTRRSRLHMRVADAISTVHADNIDAHLGELAYHSARSVGTGDLARAIEYSRRAGERALDQLAHDDAVTWFKQARDLMEESAVPTRATAEILVLLGMAERRAGDPAFRATLLSAAEAAEGVGDAELLASAALQNTRGFYSVYGDVDKERVAVLERALEAIGDAERPERACLLAHLSFELVFAEDLPRRAELADTALAIARRLDDNATLAQVLIARCTALWDPTTLEQRLAESQELLALTAALDDPYLEYFASWYSFAQFVEAGRMVDADATFDRVRGLAGELGQPLTKWLDLLMRLTRAQLRGEVDDAVALTEEQAELGARSGNADAGFFAGVAFFALHRDQDRLPEIAELVEAFAVQDDAPLGADVLWAITLCRLGRDDDARAVLDAVAEDDFGGIVHNPVWSSIVWACALVAAHLDDRPRARVLLDRLAPFTGQLVFNGLVCLDSVDSVLGLLSATVDPTSEDAAVRFDRAEALEASVGAPFLLARTRERRAGRRRLDRT